MADRLNISNMISTDLIKVMTENLRKGIILPNKEMLLKRQITMEQYEEQSRLYWRGAAMDILKCFQEGKPVVMEGSLFFQDVIESKNGPSTIRSALARRFIEKDPGLNYNTLLHDINPNLALESGCTFANLNWLKTGAIDSEVSILDELNTASQKQGVVVPLMLIMNREDHKHLLREVMLRDLKWHRAYLQSVGGLDMVIENIVNCCQELQWRMIERSTGIIVPMRLCEVDRCLERIQGLCIQQIQRLITKTSGPN